MTSFIPRIMALGAIAATAALVGGSIAQSTRTTIDLRTGPIVTFNEVANLALVLSTEFPSARAAYPRTAAYSSANKYVGYHDPNTCYGYVGTSADGYFTPNGATNASYNCNLTGTGTGFSGNFLNYANTSAVDPMRMALTGGDRYVDEAGSAGNTNPRTILQRAILPGDERSTPSGGGRNTNFYRGGPNSTSNFDKIILAAGTATAALTPFGSSSTVVVKFCDDKIFFGNTDTGSCAAPGNNANLSVMSLASASPTIAAATVTGTFKARVRVCDSTEGPVRKDLCAVQPNGTYKPVGEIQRNADKVRVAAFGYLIDSAAWQTSNEGARYGGVLRAPMKFSGAYQRDANGVKSANSQAEWDASTGVFIDKPIDTTNESGYTWSGVINYVNRFGRHARSDGVGIDIYKRRDPIGELYYEAIRYFQGQQPTPEAVGTLTATLNAGYPVYASWTDPMQTACQRNYAMLIGDNNTSKDAFVPGSLISGQTRSADTITRTAPDGTSKSVTLNANTWATVISSFETNGSTTYTDSQGVTRTANGNAPSGATGVQSGSPYNALASVTFSDSASYLYAGIAYWANTQSIRPDMPQARVRTYVIDVDEGGTGALVRSRGLYLAGKYGGFADIGQDGSAWTGEGNPFRTYSSGTLTTSDGEWLASDGTTSPVGYFMGNEPARMMAAIRNIFVNAAKPTGNLAGGSLNAAGLTSTRTEVAYYYARINPSDYSGTVLRSDIKFNTTTQTLEADPTVIWDAGKILTGYTVGTTTVAPVPLPANRKIFTYRTDSGQRGGAAFAWDSIDEPAKTHLRTSPTTAALESESIGQARLDYLRGVRSSENTMRVRANIMGDVINSSATLKGAPDANISDSGYASFYNSYKGRTPTLYVGANDGMLHAFRAADSKAVTTNGQEIFAYTPRALASKLAKLTNPDYTKEAFVDGAQSVAEAKFFRPTVSSGTVAWGSILVGGMGGGAQGLYALDVTEPENFSVNHVLWEFTDADDADMGNIVSAPLIVKLATSSNATAPAYKWFVLTTSGYNNYAVDGRASTTGKQALFLLSLDKPVADAWVLGTNYYKVVVTDPDFASTTDATGMGQSGVARARSFVANAVAAYAGDLQGNLWKFDLSPDASNASWTLADVTVKRLFVARSSGNVVQPITVVPEVVFNPQSGYQVIFGTGRFLEPTDGLDGSAAYQSIYGVWDALDGKTAKRAPYVAAGGETINGLATRSLTVTVGTSTTSITIGGSTFKYGTSSTQRRGWVVDFSGNMERLVAQPRAGFGKVFLNSTIPGGNACQPGGRSNQYIVNPFDGLAAKYDTRNVDGYRGPPSPFLVGDPEWQKRGPTGRAVVKRKETSAESGGGGAAAGGAIAQTQPTGGRMSWREIQGFQ